MKYDTGMLQENGDWKSLSDGHLNVVLHTALSSSIITMYCIQLFQNTVDIFVIK
jgi:hypothetical protein